MRSLSVIRHRGGRTVVCFSVLLLLIGLLMAGIPVSTAAEGGSNAGLPDHLMLSWTDDSHTTQTIAWRTGTDSSQDTVQYMAAAVFSGSFEGAEEAAGVAGDLYDGHLHFEATLRGLTPNTSYVYRVGRDGVWSEPAGFTTGAGEDEFAFLYMGDVQEGFDFWGGLLDKAYQDNPGIRFGLLGGDLVDNGTSIDEWQQFFAAASPVFSRIPLMPAVGNHDDSAVFRESFALPRNGPTGCEETFYSFDYGNCHFTVLNSNEMGALGIGDYYTIADWLQNDLANSEQPWKFLVFHHPPYPVVEDWRAEHLQTNWVPFFEAGGADVVFVGHQHVYMRTKPMYNGQIRPDGEGIVYIMGNAGTKYYTPGPDYDYIAEELAWVSNYQVIDINGNSLTITARDDNGQVIDSYQFVKQPIGEDPKPAMTVEPSEVTVASDFHETFELTVKDDTIVSAVYAMDIQLEGVFEGLIVGSTVTDEAYGTVTAEVYGGLTTPGNGTIALSGRVFADTDNGEWLEASVIVKDNGSGQQPVDPGDVVLTITGDGVETPKQYTLSHLQGMEQYRHLYSTINTWPTKNWYVAEGVKLRDLLEDAGMKDEAKQLKFTSRDGFTATFTVQELLNDDRYLFPHLKDNHEFFGYIPGSPDDAQTVEPILALISAESNDFGDMDDGDALHLIFGQRWLTEQTNAVFAKYVTTVEVLTEDPGQWANPTADKAGGEVPVGTMVKLSGPNNDTDKVHYTLGGSEPTVESPMYNWIAQRWWSSRSDELEDINHPIEITKNTTIKAVVIGPGKRDSDVITFEYQVTGAYPPTLQADTTKNTVGQVIELTFVDDQTWRSAITDVTVNETSIADRYTVSAGVITIESDVFTTARDYTVAVIATGYPDAVVTQRIAAGGETPPDGDVVLTIEGDGVTTPKEFTQSQLENMSQYQSVYSVINTWPSKRWYVGEGVKVRDLLNSAGMKGSARQIRFVSNDGYYTTLTVQELLRDERYCFPSFKDGGGDGDGHIPGSSSGAREVEPILALVSAEGTDDSSRMADTEALRLMIGQRAVTEQTGPLFAKRVNRIEVLTAAPREWDEPTADPGSGTVPAGTPVELRNNNMDMDKIHYTTDGSTPTIESPMYNWIAKRWWSSRSDVLEEINHPIEITEDTTIKAVTIGPGREDSDVVEFTYKVTDTAVSTSDDIEPGKGGTVSLGDEAVLEIPAGALSGNNPVEVKIERVTEPPAAPAGFRIIAGVYEFSVGGETSYSFNEPVTIKLRFDPEKVGADGTPAVYYYDQTEKKWISIGGEVSDDTITVQVEHITKFTVMAALPDSVTATIDPDEGGTVSLGDEAVLEISVGALHGTDPVEVKIERVTEPPAALAGFRIIAGVYEFSVGGETGYSFNERVTIKLRFDPEKVGPDGTPAVHCYDETVEKWVDLGGEVAEDIVTVSVDHFTKFTVMVQAEVEVDLTDIDGHWAEECIRKLVGLGAVGGYPDGTFRPNNSVTRAEFVTILVKAFALEPGDGRVFADTSGHWAENTIATAVYHGIAGGYDADTFGPNDLITREQMAAMVVKAAGLEPVTEGVSFDDRADISEWARAAVAAVVHHGVINGYPDNTVRPQGSATRAEAAAVIVNVLPEPIAPTE